MFKIITAEQAMTLMASEAITILDMRDFRSYRAGHLEGAIMLHDGLEQSLLDEGDFERPLLLYCYRGVKSREKAEALARLGFEHIYTLDGGYTGWPREEHAR